LRKRNVIYCLKLGIIIKWIERIHINIKKASRTEEIKRYFNV